MKIVEVELSIEAKDDTGLYYKMIDSSEHKRLEARDDACSFNELVMPIGWQIKRDSDGEMTKFDRARIALEGPFFNFDGTPYE